MHLKNKSWVKKKEIKLKIKKKKCVFPDPTGDFGNSLLFHISGPQADLGVAELGSGYSPAR